MKCLGKFLRGQLKSQSAQARILESGAERSALGASRRGARHSTSLHYWLEFSESKDRELSPNLISRKKPVFDLHEQNLCLLERSIWTKFEAPSQFRTIIRRISISGRLISELQIFIFRSEKIIGLLMQSDIARADGIKSANSAHRIIKSKNGIGLY